MSSFEENSYMFQKLKNNNNKTRFVKKIRSVFVKGKKTRFYQGKLDMFCVKLKKIDLICKNQIYFRKLKKKMRFHL